MVWKQREKPVFIGILTEKYHVNFSKLFNLFGIEKVRRLIISLKGDEKGNFPLSLSVKTPRPPYGASPWNCLFRLRNVQGEQGDCAVKSLTCVREPRRRSRFRSRVSAPLSARNRVKLVWLDFGISNKCRRYYSSSVSNADVHDGRWFGWRGVPIIETEWLLVDKNAASILLFHNILLPLHHNTFLFSCLRPSSRDGGADFLSSRPIREGATASPYHTS